MRYLTTEPTNGEIAVFTEADNYKEAVADAHCWIWQYAETPEQAIAQHIAKHEEWERDQNAGKPQKHTY